MLERELVREVGVKAVVSGASVVGGPEDIYATWVAGDLSCRTCVVALGIAVGIAECLRSNDKRPPWAGQAVDVVV